MKFCIKIVLCVVAFWTGFAIYDPIARNQPRGFASHVAQVFMALKTGLSEFFTSEGRYPEDLYDFLKARPDFEMLCGEAFQLNISGMQTSSNSFRLYASWPPVHGEGDCLPNFRSRQTLELVISAGE